MAEKLPNNSSPDATLANSVPENINLTDLSKPYKLTPEMKKTLEGLGPVIERAKKEADTIEKLGMDASEIRAQLALYESQLNIILKAYG